MTKDDAADDAVGVAIIFFVRPDVLQKTFEAVAKMRPKKLFLIQDGARSSSDDAKIQRCREIVSNIDWECEVHKNYSDANLGCGGRIYTGISWAFSKVAKLVIIEDDCVPSPTFLSYCTELLDKYEHDFRIDMVCGMNHLNVYEKAKHDYFFCNGGSINGWATWRRVWEKIDYNLEFLSDDDAVRLIENKYGANLIKRGRVLQRLLQKGERLSSWSYQRGLNAYLNSGLSIVPKRNLIRNIGLTEDSANSVSSLSLIPRGLRKFYRLVNYDLSFPLSHPKYIIPDKEYDKEVDKLMGNSNRIQYLYRKAETMTYRLLAGDFRGVAKKLLGILRR
ncbi:glycosyltransferase [Variovorax boronicumulans]|uniref:glycosyltransferase n=1 Tax=Variovorax boronicumulans TaxID=436515 RepID=UPI0012FD54FD|nr:glycosyltransferase [Variovorax boronicumulans]